MRRSAFGLLFSLSVFALALVPLLGSGVTTVSANGGDLCISINGVEVVDTMLDGATCRSTESDAGRPNIARAYDGGSAFAGSVAGDSGNMASATGQGSFAKAGFGDNNMAIANGDDSRAFAEYGDNNTAIANGDDSFAIAGGSTFGSTDNNTAIAIGACLVDASAGDETVTCVVP